MPQMWETACDPKRHFLFAAANNINQKDREQKGKEGEERIILVDLEQTDPLQ